ETYSRVVRQETVKILFAVAASRDYSVRVVDVIGAYLNAEIDTSPLYMSQPEGYHQGRVTTVCLLKRSIYGLRQSSNCWFKKYASVLKSVGLTQSTFDPCLFYKIKNGE